MVRERSATAARHLPDGNGGSIPARSLLFAWGMADEANAMVRKHHYSHRPPSNVQFVGSLHKPDGLLGMPGTMVAACFFSIPPTRWSEPVLELSRLVRAASQVPLTMLISLSMKRLRKEVDLVVSFADKTQGHTGYVYQAANWKYGGQRERAMDGCIIEGRFVPGRSCNSIYGTRSPEKLREQLKCDVQPHFDEGKHLYWKPLSSSGTVKAERLELKSLPYPKEPPCPA